MNKKELVLNSIRFKKVDRIPSSFRVDKSLAISLNRYFGFTDPKNIVKNYKNLINKLGADFYSSGGKICKFSTFSARYNGPEPYKPYIKDHSLQYQLGINSKLGVAISDGKKLEYEVVVEPPLAEVTRASEIKEGFLTDKLRYFDFNYFDNKYGGKALGLKKFIGSTEDFICVGSHSYFFTICWGLRGLEQFLMDLAFNKKVAEKIINEVCEFGLEYNRRELESFGEIIEYYGGVDDVAGQDGMLISPELFRKYFLPPFKQLIQMCKKNNIIFGWHCCGSPHKVLPMMIDAGIDIFDVVQTSAKDMELEKVYKFYDKKVCLHGGIDVQKLLIHGDAKDVKKEVQKIKSLWKNNGGMIVAPSHEMMPETPVENVLALYDELNC